MRLLDYEKAALWRRRLRMRQAELAYDLGTSQSHVSEYEAGLVPVPATVVRHSAELTPKRHERVWVARKRAGATQEDAGAAIGRCRLSVFKAESGELELGTLELLEQYYGV